MKRYINLDFAATTPLSKRAFNSMLPYLFDHYGNAGSHHDLGFRANDAVEKAREKIAKCLNAEHNEIYFTSGGTESNNMALKGIAHNPNKKHIIISAIEHSSIYKPCEQLEQQGYSIIRLPVDTSGLTNLNALRNNITARTAIISIMLANNEIGTIQPVIEASAIAKEKNVLFHTDAIQCAGIIELDVKKLGVDMLTLSGHKFYAPKGIGILYIKSGVEKQINPLISGGKQENGLRGGTSNVPAIVGMATALEEAVSYQEQNNKRLQNLRNYFIERVEHELPQAKLNGSYENSVPHIVNFSFGLNSTEMVEKLNERGICVSAGAACLSGSTQSNTIKALKLNESESSSAIRFSFGKYTTFEELDYTIDVIKNILKENIL